MAPLTPRTPLIEVNANLTISASTVTTRSSQRPCQLTTNPPLDIQEMSSLAFRRFAVVARNPTARCLASSNESIRLASTSRTSPKSFADVAGSFNKAGKTYVDPETKSLHSQIHFILSRRDKLTDFNIQRARAFLSIVSKWGNEQGATLCERLLNRIYRDGLSSGAHLQAEIYNIVMDAWNKSSISGDRIVSRVESLLSQMEERSADGSNMPRPDRVSYNTMIYAYSKSGEDSLLKVEEALRKIHVIDGRDSTDLYDNLQRDTCIAVMNYFSTRGEHSSAQQAEDLLLRLSRPQVDRDVKIDDVAFNLVLKAWSNSGCGIYGARRAEKLLRMMISYRLATPVSFSTVIHAYSRVERKDSVAAVDRVLSLLDELEGSHFHESDGIVSSYNAAANAIAKCEIEDAADKILDLIKRTRNLEVEPESNMYTSCIEAYANRGMFDEARKLLDNMKTNGVRPQAVAFNSILDALAKSHARHRFDKIEQWFEFMLSMDTKPDTATYSIIISAFSRSDEQKASDYLRHMLKSFRDGNTHATPNSFVFNCVINTLARSDQEWSAEAIYRTFNAMENQRRQGNDLVLPDTITMNQVISKLAKSPTKSNAKKVMTLLHKMESGPPETAPDAITYTAVLQLQQRVNSSRAAVIAARCIRQMMDGTCRMDKVMLKAVLFSLSRSGKAEDATIARDAWEFLEYNDAALLDSELANLVLMAMRNSMNDGEQLSAADAALSFLQERVKRFNEGAANTVLPTLVGFSLAIECLCKSGRVNDALKLVQIMELLDKRGLPVKPDKGIYRSLAHGRTVEKERTLETGEVDRPHEKLASSIGDNKV